MPKKDLMLFSSLEKAYFRVNSEGDPVDVKGRKITRVGRKLVVNHKNKYSLAILRLDLAASILTVVTAGAAYGLARMPYVLAAYTGIVILLVASRVFLAYHGAIEPKPRQIVADNISRWDYFWKRVALKVIFTKHGTTISFIGNLLPVAFLLFAAYALHNVDSIIAKMFAINSFVLGVVFLVLVFYFFIAAQYSKLFYRNKPNLPEAFRWDWQENPSE